MTADSSAPVTVRPAHVGDVPAIEEVQEAAGRAELLDGVRAAVPDPERLVLVAEAERAVIGWAKTHRFRWTDGVAPAGHYLGGVTVTPAWRRRGVGTALTATRMDWLAGRAARVFYLANARNTASLALHRRWGFHEVVRAPVLHGVRFAGGVGVLLAADLPGPSGISAGGGPR
ncbi:GNAT family N-acetyltransferase [Isoptericola sediminis]|uniref:GNAT family N-acetyltransferase n=1 Tax=Isoptericola sediminis TaxID=2733572 RepID=A0A849K4Z1_9MICO|nr:GNAT family N-acetyltransferase [Isoptericola sediminis]NNU26865.1 GNAT family N-acetyltransferase [Isoptericola sediminis]